MQLYKLFNFGDIICFSKNFSYNFIMKPFVTSILSGNLIHNITIG